MQSEVLGRSLKVLDGALEALEDDFRSTRRLQYSTTKSSGAYQTRAHGLCTPHRCEEDFKYPEGRKKLDSNYDSSVILLGLYFIILLGLLPCNRPS